MFRVYYDDGSTYEGDPYQAPRLGVIAIVQHTEHEGRTVYAREDYYWWDDDDTWRGGDLFGMWDYLLRPGPRCVLFGRLVHNATYRDISERAFHDDDIPRGVTPGWPTSAT